MAIPALIFGLWLMVFCSKKTIDYSAILATAFGISPLVIGVVFVALGTDFPEIINSIVSSYLGHADINIGDSLGSVLSQMTIMFGLLPFFGGPIKLKRREVLVIGSCLILSLLFLFMIFDTGGFNKLQAFLMIFCLILFFIISAESVGIKDFETPKVEKVQKGKFTYIAFIFINLIGVGLGSYLVINSVIYLAEMIHFPEFLVSFFILGIGTSLPELFVTFTAIHGRHYNIAIGNILGSCLIDATLSIGIGQFLFPQPISALLARRTTLFLVVLSIFLITLLAVRRKIDKRIGALMILTYIASYFWLFG